MPFKPRAPRAARLPAARLRLAARDWVTGLGVPEFPADRAGLETLVGRYAAVAVGALVLLMGVGAFLTWAVENFTLAPAARVALGALGAAALAALGERLRHRDGAQRFGEVLLALALAVVHVDAWAAGPYLHVVNAEWALAVAAAASGALTALAWRTRQQSLFVVGVGGALLAPFVSGVADVHPLVRPVYGWLVLTAGLAALVRGTDARRPWRGAARLLGAGTAMYAFAQLDPGVSARTAAGAPSGLLLGDLLHDHEVASAFTLACAAGPLAILFRRVRGGAGPSARGDATSALLARLALAELSTAAVVLWAAAGASVRSTPSLVGYALAAMAGTQLITAVLGAALPAAVTAAEFALAGLALPLATLGAALVALGRAGTPMAAGVAALWSALSAAGVAAVWRGTRRTAGEARAGADPRLGPQLAAAGFASAIALVDWTRAYDVPRLALLGAHGALAAAVFARAPGRGGGRDGRPLLALAAPLGVLAAAAVWGAVQLAARPAFGYVPFLTGPSAAVAVVVGGWAVCAGAVWHAGDDLLPRTERAAVVAVAAAVALLWGREELAHAFAPDVATFLLVGYFAVAGVGALAVGRARRVAAARQAGLALALYAALKAIVEVSQLDSVALRVGSYLLVGGFLLGVGYWYRAGAQPVEPVGGVVHDVP